MLETHAHKVINKMYRQTATLMYNFIIHQISINIDNVVCCKQTQISFGTSRKTQKDRQLLL